MALKLAIVLVNDDTGQVDKVLLEHDITDAVASELGKRRIGGKKRAQAVRDAFALYESKIRNRTTALT